MTSVRCILCTIKKELEEKEPKAEFPIRSSVISKNEIDEFQLIGAEMVEHLQAYHEKELIRIVQLNSHWNGFNVSKYFEAEKEDSQFEKEKESMRDILIEEVMMFSPDDEEELEEDDLEDEDCEDDDDDDYENDLTDDENKEPIDLEDGTISS